MPQLTGFDHIHIYVPSRAEAAEWFKSVLGFKISESLRFWATENGPLVIENESATVHLALFKQQDFIPSTAIAFASDADNFLKWKETLEAKGIKVRCSDHQLAWSLYFHDPYKNMYEITTYDHAQVSQVLLEK
ncbi:MAG: VOC family protein [Candidatus Marinimicrobia bacterium]|jgi:catechol-2,3-dioxygenase|nr:VOC family protein [Candidatus Neomarinimicrobiota bacterium]MBT3635012.1 VOC family protein [Candidatus Neomarinimicrobiota bacterium]MBT3683843.1 VOC family protein [Candidatus Neomarinimicrobiota bacterium]MBT3760664.1 VOC family protein [Candidatus Neomarinimicrobiota bacterium]MBT3896853.1 VOC family protein [Candidatus Neomarinimicrobiota bacterium]